MNQKGFANIILVVVIIILVGIVSYFSFVKKSKPVVQQPTPTPESKNSVLSELQRLNIQVTGQEKQIELELPPILSDANWGMKKIICEEGGYNLSAYAGKTLLFTSYPINEVWNSTEPLNVWIVTSGDKIVCVYKTVGENSNAAPGIFSIKENPSIKKK